MGRMNRIVRSMVNCNWSDVTAVVRRACHVDASSAGDGRIASTCSRHGIYIYIYISLFRRSRSRTHRFHHGARSHVSGVSGWLTQFASRACIYTHTRATYASAANVALRRLLFHESRRYGDCPQSSLRCITTECRKFAVGFVDCDPIVVRLADENDFDHCGIADSLSFSSNFRCFRSLLKKMLQLIWCCC